MGKCGDKRLVPKKSAYADEQGEHKERKRDTLDTNPTRPHGGNLLRSRRHSKTKQCGK